MFDAGSAQLNVDKSGANLDFSYEGVVKVEGFINVHQPDSRTFELQGECKAEFDLGKDSVGGTIDAAFRVGKLSGKSFWGASLSYTASEMHLCLAH